MGLVRGGWPGVALSALDLDAPAMRRPTPQAVKPDPLCAHRTLGTRREQVQYRCNAQSREFNANSSIP